MNRFNLKRLSVFFTVMILSVILHVLLFRLYMYLFPGAIIFFCSIIVSILVSVIEFFLLLKLMRFKIFLSLSISFNILFTLFILSVFGPVFVDRSISYEIVFLTEKNKTIDLPSISKFYDNSIFEKRFDDAVKSGVLEKINANKYVATKKGIIINKFLLLLKELYFYN